MKNKYLEKTYKAADAAELKKLRNRKKRGKISNMKFLWALLEAERK